MITLEVHNVPRSRVVKALTSDGLTSHVSRAAKSAAYCTATREREAKRPISYIIPKPI